MSFFHTKKKLPSYGWSMDKNNSSSFRYIYIVQKFPVKKFNQYLTKAKSDEVFFIKQAMRSWLLNVITEIPAFDVVTQGTEWNIAND